MQSDAVHCRRHAELTDAVAHIAAGKVVCLERLHALGDRQIRVGQVGRAAERRLDRGVDHFERHFGRLARGDLGLFGNEVRLVDGHAAGEVGWNIASRRRLEAKALRVRSQSVFPRQPLTSRAVAGQAPRRHDLGRNLKRRVRPAESGARGLDLRSAERRPCDASVPCLFGAPNPITVRQAISVGRSCRLLPRSRPRSLPDRDRQPRSYASRLRRSARADRDWSKARSNRRW